MAVLSDSSRLSILTKVYIWSIVFESLMFFVLGSQSTTGFSFSIGKLLQMVVVLFILIQLLTFDGKIKIENPFNQEYRLLVIFFLLAVFSSGIGYLNQAYILNEAYTNEDIDSLLAGIVRSSSFRPIFEYIILLYYIVYFVILPKFFIKDEASLKYFFKIFKKGVIICLLLGFADIFLQLGGLQVLPRDMWEGRLVGFRFHGIAGEPRDAFVYLFFTLAVLNLRSYYFFERSISKKWIYIIIIAALLTQSGSGILGVIFAIGIYSFYSVSKLSIRSLLVLSLFFVLGSTFIYLAIINSERLMAYIELRDILIRTLEADLPPTPLMATQVNNVYPIWDLYLKVKQGIFSPLIFGSGLGSASVVNNNYSHGVFNGLTNPHSQVIRLIYENGIIGTIIFIIAFLIPTRKIISRIDAKEAGLIFLFTVLLLGLNLSHRGTSIFIYFGVMITVFRLKFNSHNDLDV